MRKFLIGTSGYDYPEWKGFFYPEELKRDEFLSYYATQFNALELNFSFYGMPDAARMQSFYDRTEGRLQFSVKANQLLTHKIDNTWQTCAEDFKKALEPLVQKDVLSAVLFQFPQSFHYTPENRIYLSKLIQTFSGFPVVVEFRHSDWIKESVFAGLEKMKASLCFCDMPHLKNLPAMSLSSNPDITKDEILKRNPFIGPAAYIRLHGRNEKAWYAVNEGLLNASPLNEPAAAPTDSAATNTLTANKSFSAEHTQSVNGSQRYVYDYSSEELAQFVPVINVALNSRKVVHVFFNNHPGGSGAKNAKLLRQMVKLSNFGTV